MRRTKAPDQIETFARRLSRFTFAAIDLACTNIENAERQKGEAAFPELGRLIGECKRTSAGHVNTESSTFWTVERYADCRSFDIWLREKAERAGRPVAALLDELGPLHPKMVAAWRLWRSQRRDGTLQCPGWCENCLGVRWRTYTDPAGDTFAERCPVCLHR